MVNKILIVDDDKRNVLLLESALKRSYQIRVAYSGEEALNVLEAFNADVVLLDIMMPGMSGYDVCNAIREHAQWKFIKVLLVSAKVLPSDRVLGYECGADDYITKPFNIDELRAKIKVFARLKHSEELDSLKSNLIMLISHEIRTPMTGVVGATEILKEALAGRDDLAEVFEILEGNSCRLKHFVEKIIQLSAIKRGIVLHKQEVALMDLLTEVRLTQENNFETIVIDNLIDMCSRLKPIKVCVDPYFMAIALSSLLQHISDMSHEQLSIELDCQRHNESFMLKVFDANKTDNKDSDYNVVCDPLNTDDIYHYHNGNGLDMAIVYGIVRAHDGYVKVELNQSGNQVFTITLPLLCTV